MTVETQHGFEFSVETDEHHCENCDAKLYLATDLDEAEWYTEVRANGWEVIVSDYDRLMLCPDCFSKLPTR